MEPNKLEKQFREQLNSREIKPSEMAWGKLDAMLSEAEKPKTKFPWLYVAASFVGFLLIATLYFSQKENPIENGKNAAVVQDSVVRKTRAITLDSVPLKIVEKVVEDQVVRQRILTTSVISERKQESIAVSNEVSIINQNSNIDSVAISSEKKNFSSINKNKYVSAEKLLAEVSNTKFESKEADKVIVKTKKSVSVNPKSLLSGVETELNQSFRESALDRLNKNFNTIKTVLANRNYENK